MSILHRIFVSKRKNKKIFTGRKLAYKKFLGLRTLKTVLYTKLSSMTGRKVAKKIIKQRTSKKTKPTRRVQLKFPILKLLTPYEVRQELICAQGDVAKFKSLQVSDVEEEMPEKTFQAFLPQTVWDKMTSAQRGEHIKKRKALTTKHQTYPAPRYMFSNSRSRPLLTKLNFKKRRQYLKTLIKFAGAEDYEAVTPSPGKDFADKARIIKVKSILRGAKKIRVRQRMYKNLTCASLVPDKVTLLVLKHNYAKI